MAKVLIAETVYLIRKGLVALLHQLEGVAEIETATDTEDVMRKLKSFKPDILILKSPFPSLPVQQVQQSMQRGSIIIPIDSEPAPTNAPLEQISIFEDEVTLTKKLSAHLQRFRNKPRASEDAEELTPREKLILTNVALGYTNKEIAARLFISTHTVISHRKNITRKLQIKTVSGLTVYAILNNLLKIEDIGQGEKEED